MTETYRLLARVPHPSLQLGQVAQAAEVSKGLIHYYFGTKDALILATIEHFVQLHTQLLQALAQQDKPAAERLNDLVAALLPDRELLEERVHFAVEVWSYAKTHPGGLATVHHSFAALREVCTSLIELGRAEGFVTAPADHQLVRSITAIIDGLAMHAAYDPGADLAEVRALARRSLDALLRPGSGDAVAAGPPPQTKARRRGSSAGSLGTGTGSSKSKPRARS